jgi:hypothetical protein
MMPMTARRAGSLATALVCLRTGVARTRDVAKLMLGGMGPSSPHAAEEFAQRLRRQAGWKRVDYKGDGLFEVDFAIEGRLDHDFTFPTIERFPMANQFVQVALRSDGGPHRRSRLPIAAY